jgi:protein involved in polysaccharide export with SLBB domain
VTGCALDQQHLDHVLLADRGAGKRNEGVAECYLVHCPDVLAIQVPSRPDMTGPHAVGPDGRIDLGSEDRLRVEGRTVPEVARLVARETRSPPEHVHVGVASFNSQQVYLIGPGIGAQRAVGYQGPETILDLLHRTGGIASGAAPNDVYLVRSHISEDRQPEVYHINLSAILMRKDQRTNLRVQPFDQVYIGETRQASMTKCVPPCFRPLYRCLCGLETDKETRRQGDKETPGLPSAVSPDLARMALTP